MKFPKRERTAGRAETQHVIRRTGRRLNRSGHVGRQQTAVSCAGVETLLRRRLTEQHFAPVVRAHCRAGETIAAVREHVERDVIRVRPHTHFRIIRKIRVRERIAIPRACRIAGLRNRDALQIRRRTDRELRNNPAIGHSIVNHHRVAVVVGLAAAAKSAPQSVDRHRTVNQAAALIIYGEIGVHGLDIVIRTDVTVGIRRS